MALSTEVVSSSSIIASGAERRTQQHEADLDVPHKILLIESQPFADALKEGLLLRAEFPGRPITSQTFEWFDQPAYGVNEFVQILAGYTGAILHNLALKHLRAIEKFAQENPERASQLIVIKTGGSATSEHTEIYFRLQELGVMVTTRNYLMSQQEAVVQRIFKQER